MSVGKTSAERKLEEWRAIRKEAGLKINPETAEVHCCYALTLDPYGVYPELPEEYRQVERTYFARSPGSDVWVEFGSAAGYRRRAVRKTQPKDNNIRRRC